MVTYKEITPLNAHAIYIDRYWFSENVGSRNCEITILPDCCMDIIFDLSTQTIIVCGVMTTAQTITMKPGQKMFGVRFLPGVLPAMLNMRAVQFTDSILCLEEINYRLAMSLRELLNTSGQQSECVTFCNNILGIQLQAISKKTMIDLSKLPADYSVHGLSQYLNTSVRQTQRIFAKYIGITPKRFLQIKRFMTLQQELQHNTSSLSDLSVTNGYFDQAHMHKEYQLLTKNAFDNANLSRFYNTNVETF